MNELKNAALGMKGTLVNNGRCPKCTLKPPCKHYEKIEDLPSSNEVAGSSAKKPIEQPKQLETDFASRYASTNTNSQNQPGALQASGAQILQSMSISQRGEHLMAINNVMNQMQ